MIASPPRSQNWEKTRIVTMSLNNYFKTFSMLETYLASSRVFIFQRERRYVTFDEPLPFMSPGPFHNHFTFI